MLIALGLGIAGLVAMIAGAELLVGAGGRLAGRLGVSPLVIGLTVVALGTSAPELAVGIEAAVQGNGGLAVGNIAGTNIVNILLILGLSAAIEPLAIQLRTIRIDLPAMVAAALAMTALAWDGVLSRADGWVLLAGAAAFTLLIIRAARRESLAVRTEFGREYLVTPGGTLVVWRDFAMLCGGIAVVVGADWLVDGAVSAARIAGVSDAFVGLTVVALGTSAPELVTTIVSTVRRERDIAVGNLLGSSVYNIVAIMGATCVVPAAGLPVSDNLRMVDLPLMTLVALVCVPVFMSGRRVSRAEGVAFVVAYLAYFGYLVVDRT